MENFPERKNWFIKKPIILEEYHGHISNAELEQRLNYNSDYINRVVKKKLEKIFPNTKETSC